MFRKIAVRPLLLAFALAPLAAVPALKAEPTNLTFAVPGETSARSRENFDTGWRFARFGLMPDGTRAAEPGKSSRKIALTASSEESDKGNFAELAMDGDLSTRWCASGGEAGQWLRLDLGERRGVAKADIVWENDTGYSAVVEGSADGKSWSPLPGDFRHIRIRVTKTPPAKWASIREVRLTGVDGKPIENTPVASPGSPQLAGFDDSGWRKLDLPHDFGIEGPFRLELAGDTGKLPWKGIGWYRKTFAVSDADLTRRMFVDFDGVMANAKVWINGHELPAHPYGYTSFRLDLTPYLKSGDNVLAVRTDTEKWDSRWYPGAGIYRHVWLVKTAPVHVAHDGVTVTTPEVSPEKATVRIVPRIDGSRGAVYSVKYEIFEIDPDDRAGVRVAKGSGAEFTAGNPPYFAELTLNRPKLWSPDAPNRYLLRTHLFEGDKEIDTYDTPFGVRTLKFTARDGFLLNGKRTEIKGVCMHHDLGALGAALNDSALERQLVKLKEMGCNAIRTSHNPPAPELLDLCDRMGFLVWDEAFDCWAHGKRANDYNRLFKVWHERDLRDLVKRDRNHPSVIIWSIGNEVMEQTDVALTKHLADIMRDEDPTRPVSNGYNNPDGGRGSGACVALDVMGVNYFFGQQAKWDADPRYKDMPTVGSETSSCVSSRGEYFFGTNRANWQISSYDNDRPGWGCTPDDQFRTNAKFPNLLGEFVWTGFDYLGEPTPYLSGDNTQLLNFRNDPSKRAQLEKEMAELAKRTPPSRSSYFGIIDLAGFPKDRFYSYQAHWRPELPMAHLLPHWNWPERVGQKTPVQLYTSGDEAELFLNGVSQGRKKKTPGKDFRLLWPDVVYRPGELKVVAYKDGKKWAEDVVKTTGAPAKLALAPERSAIAADGRDLAFVALRIEDKDGLTVPRTHNRVKFTVSGPGEVIATDNGDATSFESFQSPERKAFNGLALAIVRLKPGATGEVTVTATSDGLAPATTTLRAK